MEILTDAQGEYFLDQYGSKHRKAGKNSWTLQESDMTQEHKDALAAQAVIEQERQEAEEARIGLEEIDKLSIRSIREIMIAEGKLGFNGKLATLEVDAVEKRKKLK
jgi:hypothetical protein